jgi:hypothetical protein
VESLRLSGTAWMDDLPDVRGGEAVWAMVCELGLEGVVATKETSRYLPGQRGWIKTKNPNYWRRDAARGSLPLAGASGSNSRLAHASQYGYTSPKPGAPARGGAPALDLQPGAPASATRGPRVPTRSARTAARLSPERHRC